MNSVKNEIDFLFTEFILVSAMETFDASFKDCGGIVREKRLKKGLTLRELAVRSGCNFSHLSKVENSTLSLSLQMIEQIAKGLGIESEEIMLDCLTTTYPEMGKTPAGKVVAQYLSSVARGTK